MPVYLCSRIESIFMNYGRKMEDMVRVLCGFSDSGYHRIVIPWYPAAHTNERRKSYESGIDHYH